MQRLQELIACAILFFIILSCSHGPQIKYLPEQSPSIEQITKDKKKQEIIKRLIIEKAQKIAEKRLVELVRERKLKEKQVEKEKHKVLKQILKLPPMPIKLPDTVLRALILPYTDENGVLHGYSYLYLKVEEGKWLLGDYLLSPIKISDSVNTKPKRGKKLIEPLKAK